MPDGAEIRIKIGIATDANASSVMAPIEQAVKRTRKAVESDMKAAERSISGETAKGTTSAERSWAKLEKELEREANKMLRAEERAAKAAAKAVIKENKEKEKANKKEKDDFEKNEVEKTRVAAREAKQRERIRRQAERETKRRERAKKQADREFEHASDRENKQLLGFGRHAASLAGSAVSGALGVAGEIAGGLGVETNLGSLVSHGQEQQSLATKISNAGYVPGTTLADPKDILAEARQVGIETGTDTTMALKALEEFVGKTGDLDVGRKTLGQMATLARATGSNLEDMASAAAEVSNNLGDVPNKAEVTNHIMQMIAGQGKLGAVEIKDMASQMAKLGAASTRFEGGAAKNIPLMGVLAQEAKLRGGAASAGQAATAVTAFASDFAQKANLKNWAARGLTPFADKAHTILSDPKSLIEAALKSASGKDGKGAASLDVLKTLFPSKQGFKAVQGFAALYNEAGGGSKGMAAVDEEFRRLTNAQLANEEVQRAFAASMKTSEAQVAVFNNKMTAVAEQLAGAVIPAFEELAPKIVGFTESMANLLGNITGANRDEANRELDQLPTGTAAKDKKLLEDTATVIHGAGGDTKAYSAEQRDVILHHGALRGAAMAKLQTQIDNEESDAKELNAWSPMKAMREAGQKAMGLETDSQKAERLHQQASEDMGRMEEMRREQKATNDLLREIRDHGLVVSTKPGAPKPAQGAPAEADVDKD